MLRTNGPTREALAVAMALCLLGGARDARGAGADAGETEATADVPAPGPEPRKRYVRFALALDDDGAFASCGGASALARDVEDRVRRPVFVARDDADIVFEITRPSSGTARIVQRGHDGEDLGERDVPLLDPSCAKARETVAVVLAIMIGPPRAIEDAPDPLPPAPLPPPPPEPVPAAPAPLPAGRDTPPAAPRRPKPTFPPWTVTPTADFVVGSGILPGLGWGLQAGVGARLPVLALELTARGHYWPTQTTGTRPTSEVDRLGGALLLCHDLVDPSARLRTAGCLGGSVSRLHARSSDLTRPSSTGFVADILAEATLGYRAARGRRYLVEPRVSAQVSALVQRDRFLYRDYAGQSRILLQPSPVAFQAGIGVAVHIW